MKTKLKAIAFLMMIILCLSLLTTITMATSTNGGNNINELDRIEDNETTPSTVLTEKNAPNEDYVKVNTFLQIFMPTKISIAFSVAIIITVNIVLIRKHNKAMKAPNTTEYAKNINLINRHDIYIGTRETVVKNYYQPKNNGNNSDTMTRPPVKK